MADLELGSNPENLKWQPPTENEDGSPVNGPLNYRIYRSESEALTTADFFMVIVGTLQQDGTYEAPLDQFPVGRSVVALTAVDADGDESTFSNTVGFSVTDGVTPRPPVLLPS